MTVVLCDIWIFCHRLEILFAIYNENPLIFRYYDKYDHSNFHIIGRNWILPAKI